MGEGSDQEAPKVHVDREAWLTWAVWSGEFDDWFDYELLTGAVPDE